MSIISLKSSHFRKTFSLDGGLSCTSLIFMDSKTEYCVAPFPEVSFNLDNGNPGVPTVSSEGQLSNKLEFQLEYPTGIGVVATYTVSKGENGYLKQLRFINHTEREVCLTNIVLDRFHCSPGVLADCELSTGTDLRPLPAVFAMEGTEDLVRVYSPAKKEGYYVGTFAPGPLRRFMFYPHWGGVMTTTYAQGVIPCEIYLKPGEVFDAAETFFTLFSGENGTFAVADTARTALPPAPAPGVMYCTWIPFLKNINEELVLSLIERASYLKFSYFVLDDGWFTEEDHAVDLQKFPHGLEPISEAAHAAGLKFGLWYAIGTSYGERNPDPAFACRLENGAVKYAGNQQIKCLASDYREHALQALVELARKYQVDYFKIDFSHILSPYCALPWGCHAHNHSHHHGYNDYFIQAYKSMDYIRDELHKLFPDLIVDFSFEHFGTDKPNFAALKACNLHHASNLSANDRTVQSFHSIRNTYKNWFTHLPVERILGGLLALREDNAIEGLLTSFMGAPLVAGDLRQLSPKTCDKIRRYVTAFQEINADGPMDLIPQTNGYIRMRGKTAFRCLFNDKLWSKVVARGWLDALTMEPFREQLVPGQCVMLLKP